jgi:hypothetical protein
VAAEENRLNRRHKPRKGSGNGAFFFAFVAGFTYQEIRSPLLFMAIVR